MKISGLIMIGMKAIESIGINIFTKPYRLLNSFKKSARD